MAKSASFPTTDWTLIDKLHTGSDAEQLRFLNQIAGHYWPPIYRRVVSRGVGEVDALDTTQEFFAFALATGLLGKAKRDKGRFRTFLLSALDHFLANVRRARRAKKRGPEALTSIEQIEANEYLLPAGLVSHDTAKSHCHRQWIRDLIAAVLQRLEHEFSASGRQSHYRLFVEWIVVPELEGGPARSLQTIAAELDLDYKQAANRILTTRRAFKRILIEELRRHNLTEKDGRLDGKDLSTLFQLGASDR